MSTTTSSASYANEQIGPIDYTNITLNETDTGADTLSFIGSGPSFGSMAYSSMPTFDGIVWGGLTAGTFGDPTGDLQQQVLSFNYTMSAGPDGEIFGLDNQIIGSVIYGPDPGVTFAAVATVTDAAGDVVATMSFDPNGVDTPTWLPTGYSTLNVNLTITSTVTNPGVDMSNDAVIFSGVLETAVAGSVSIDKQISVDGGKTWYDVGDGVLQDPSTLVGGTVEYRVVVTNDSSDGISLANATVNDVNGPGPFTFGGSSTFSLASGAVITSDVMTATAVAGHQIDTATLTGSFTDGAHSIAATASDTADYTATSPATTVTVDKQVSLDGKTWFDIGSGVLNNPSVMDGCAVYVRVVVTNTSSATITGASVEDSNGQYFTFSSSAATGCGTQHGGTVSTTTIAAGATVTSNIMTLTAVAGHQIDTATLTGMETLAGQTVSVTGSDTADYTGLAPSISVLKVPDAVAVTSGEQETYTFYVSNTGTAPLYGVQISDNIGTAADPDDVTPTAVTSGGYNVGDVNHNGVLDPGEVWQYTETLTVTAGSGSNGGSAGAGGGTSCGGWSYSGGSACGSGTGNESGYGSGGWSGGSDESGDGSSCGGWSYGGCTDSGYGSDCGYGYGAGYQSGYGCNDGSSSYGNDDSYACGGWNYGNGSGSCGSNCGGGPDCGGSGTGGATSVTDLVTVTASTLSQGQVTSCQTLSHCNATSGRTLWLNACFKPASTADGACYSFNNVSVQVCGGGKTITEQVPNCEVVFSGACKQASTVYNANTNCWVTTLPAGQNCGNVFLSGVPVQVPSGCNLSDASVTWSIGSSSNNCGTSNLSWQTSAATFNNFCVNGGNGYTDYNTIGVQSCDASGNCSAGFAVGQNNWANCSSLQTQTCGTVCSTCTTTVTASDAKEIQVLGSNSNVTIGGTAPTGNLPTLYGTAEKLEFTYNPGDTVSLASGSTALASITGATPGANAFMEITSGTSPNASGAQIYFEGNVTTGENIFADATVNPLTGAAVTGSNSLFSTASGAELHAFVFAGQQAFQSGAAPVETLAYGTGGQMNLGDTIGSLKLAGYVGTSGGHLVA